MKLLVNLGDSDVTVIFKAQPGSRRWQHIAGGERPNLAGQGPQGHAQDTALRHQTELNYTVTLGSHRNTCLKFEKDGQLCEKVRGSETSLGRGGIDGHVGKGCEIGFQRRWNSGYIEDIQKLHQIFHNIIMTIDSIKLTCKIFVLFEIHITCAWQLYWG